MKTVTANSPTDASVTKPENLKALFEGLYAKYNRKELIRPDPLQFVYRYTNPADMEIVGLLSACLAYGRVEQIQNDLNDLLGRMGNSPHKFVLNFTNKNRVLFEGFKHRFNTGDDISDLLALLKGVLAEYGSIEKYFLLGYDTAQENTIFALMRFCDSLLGKYRMTHQGRKSKGLAFLLAGPGLGGAAKRLNLFLPVGPCSGGPLPCAQRPGHCQQQGDGVLCHRDAREQGPGGHGHLAFSAGREINERGESPDLLHQSQLG